VVVRAIARCRFMVVVLPSFAQKTVRRESVPTAKAAAPLWECKRRRQEIELNWF